MSPERPLVRIYRAFLRLYPRSFRDLFAADMMRTFEARLEEAAADPPKAGRWRLLATELASVVRGALAQRLGGSAADHGMPLGSPLRSVPTLNTRRNDPMSRLAQELRHAVRRLVRSPGFALASVVTLGLGIGATTAVYSVVHSIVLRPLPYPDSERLVWLDHAGPGIGSERGLGMTRGLYAHYRDRVDAFEDLAAWTRMEVTVLGEEPRRFQAIATTPELFRMLGVRPALGSAFGPETVMGESSRTVVVSHRFWTVWFGADPDAVGRTISASGAPLEVVAVMPPGFAFPDPEVDVWIPIVVEPGVASLGGFSWEGVARLAPGATIQRAAAEARGALPEIRERFGAGRTLDETRLAPVFPTLRQETVRETERTLWILLGSVVFVLLLACANVANLLLVRAESRQRETAIRRALGAGRLEVIRYHLSEGVLLSSAGGVLGIVLAHLAVRVLVAAGPANLPRLAEVSVSPAVLAFTALLLLATSLIFALVPGLRRGPAVAATMKASDARAGLGRGPTTGRGALVVTQVALALVLLVATGLMARSFLGITRYDPGFETGDRITFRIGLSPHDYPDDRSSAAFHREALDRIGALPGVEVAGATSCLPLCDRWQGTQLEVEGRPDDPSSAARVVAVRRVNESLFEALGIELVAGRLPDRFEHESESGAAVISSGLVDAYWSGEDPLGARFRPAGGEDWYTVVGVVEDTPINGFADPARPIAYLPLVYGSDGTNSPYELSYVLLTSVRPQSVLPAVREAIRTLDANVPISGAATMEEVAAEANVETAFTTVVLGIASAIALLLGMVGIYGVISYGVGRRTREIGIRLAMGARAGQVTLRLLRDGGKVTAIGLAVGLAAAFGLTRLMRGLLFGVSPTDPVAFVSASLLLAAVALAATWIPARRSARVDPARTLRAE